MDNLFQSKIIKNLQVLKLKFLSLKELDFECMQVMDNMIYLNLDYASNVKD